MLSAALVALPAAAYVKAGSFARSGFQPPMPTARLDDRAIVSVSGPDAESFLQNIVTADLDALQPGEAKPSALLTPQGKILFDFLVSRNGADAFRLECRADIADDFVRRLTLYKLRAKVEISKQDRNACRRFRGEPSQALHETINWLRDTRFPQSAPAWRSYEGTDRRRRRRGMACRSASRTASPRAGRTMRWATPSRMTCCSTRLDGVGFRKGCYVGQEVVSRMQHRGTARRRVLIVSGENLPASGTEIVANGRALGTLGSTAGGKGLAILRIDRVKDALDAGVPIEAGGVPVTVAIPGWATFTYPEKTSSEDA